VSLPDLVVLLGVLVAVSLSIHFVHQHWESTKRREFGDVAGFIFGAVAVMYSVLLAFVAVVGWETLSSGGLSRGWH